MNTRIANPVLRLLTGLAVVLFFAAWLFSDLLFPGNSALYRAVELDDAAAVRELVRQGVDPNSQAEPLTLTYSRTALRRFNYPPLIYALRHLKRRAALALVEAGADPNARSGDGRTALDMARSGHLDDVVQALVVRGAHGSDSGASPATSR